MLPMCFYLAPDGSEPLQQLEEDPVETARYYVDRIWGAVGRIRGTHASNDPFFTVEFAEIVYIPANNLACSSSLLGALRVAARAQVYRAPYSRDCIHNLIHCADECRRKILAERMTLSF